jgi:hypothetical protein
VARIRTIKPQFFRSHELYAVEFQANRGRQPGAYLNVRTAFAGFFVVADREGRFRWRPHELKLDILPYDPVDFAEVMAALAAGPRPFIVKYAAGGEAYGFIPGFPRHQRPKVDEAASTLPPPPSEVLKACEGQLSLIGTDVDEPESDRSPTGVQSTLGIGKGNREGEQEGKGVRTGRAAAPRFTPPTVEEVRAYCEERKNRVDAQRFVDHYAARGWKPKGYTQTMKDWRAAVRTWERADDERGGRGGGAAGAPRGGGGGGGAPPRVAGAAAPAPGKYDHLG